MRFTPAGLPAIDLVLRHEGEAVEAQHARRVAVEIKAKAIGEDLVRQVGSINGDAVYTGFLAATRNGKGVVFHLSTIEPAPASIEQR